MADIVVYGGSFAGVAAAAKAAANAPSKTIAIIVPDPVGQTGSCFGSIGTIGGQNFFDEKRWNGTDVTKGTYAWWRKGGQFYNTDAMAAKLESDLTKYGSQITMYKGYDISKVSWGSSGISSVTLKKLKRDSTGVVQWDTSVAAQTLSGTVFIDASDTGRLTRLSNFGGTVGRYDWPEELLDADEKGSSGKAHQQAATLMFKIKGVDTSAEEKDLKHGGMKKVFEEDDNTGIYYAAAGHDTYYNNQAVKDFNDENGPQGFAIKPYNAAQDGPGSEEYWMNMLLVFNVDGRAYNRDKDTAIFPKDMRSDYKTVDDAWVEARNFIQKQEFMDAVNQFPGLKQAELVLDADGKPVVGEVLYLREVIHSAQSSTARDNGTYDNNYALHQSDCLNAGASSTDGEDARNYAKRIGLNFYLADINAYQFKDLKNAKGQYIWGSAISEKLMGETYTEKEMANKPKNPVYVPYDALATNFMSNLLIPGYATGVSSLGWAEVRVIPNLCVLGDAAGVAAAYAVNNNKKPLNFSTADIAKIQATLTNSNARLEK